jgi:chemotaxis protein MotB
MRLSMLAVSVAMLGGCGVSQELFDARGTEITKLRGELNQAHVSTADAKRACDARIAEIEKSRQSDQADAAKRLAELKAQADARAKQFQELMGKLRSMVDSGKLKVEFRNGLMLVKMADNILFDSGKADLKAGGKATLKELAAALLSITGRKFQVAGHTDDQPLGKKSRFKDNWALSTARAVEVVNFMIKDGAMPPDRLSAAGWADQLPVAKNDGDPGRQQNRRIEVVLLPNIDELPAMSASK